MSTPATAHAQHDAGPHTGLRTYLAVYLALMALMALTFGAAFFDLGAANFALAMGIAIAKMVLIILYFMHIRHSDSLTRVFAFASFLWFLLFVALTLNDYFTRGLFGVSGK